MFVDGGRAQVQPKGGRVSWWDSFGWAERQHRRAKERNAMNGRASSKKEFSKRGEKPTTYRRVVTENPKGKAVVQSVE